MPEYYTPAPGETFPAGSSPCQITVFCDECSYEVTGDYLVYDSWNATQRHAVARAWLVRHQGWLCRRGIDLCPSCRPQALRTN